MKIGFVSAILDGWDFQQTISIASRIGYQCVEVACWPHGEGERRYAGVSHIDVTNLSDSKISEIKSILLKENVEISSLAFYPNPLDSDPHKRQANINHLLKVIDASAALGVNMVTTFIGRDQKLTVEENLKQYSQVWPFIIQHAEDKKVKVAIENCPMLFSADQWPGGQNLATNPKIWREMFKIIPSNYFGLNYDPSHMVWQMMDYLAPIYEFKDKLFHIHFKDIKLYKEKLDQVGIMAYPLDFMAPKLPGLGDVDWGRFVSALGDIGYDGFACVEVEDRFFEGTQDKIIKSLELSYTYLKQFVI